MTTSSLQIWNHEAYGLTPFAYYCAKELFLKFSFMYSDAGRPKKSREDKQRELFLQKRSRKGLNKGKEMELQSGFRFRDVPKSPSLYHLLQFAKENF